MGREAIGHWRRCKRETLRSHLREPHSARTAKGRGACRGVREVLSGCLLSRSRLPALGFAAALAAIASTATADDAPVQLFIGGQISQDAPLISGDDVCGRASQLDSGFSCFRESGSQYHGTPITGAEDKVAPGLVLGTTRLTLSADYVLDGPLSLGLRLGYVLRGGGPRPDGGKKFMPYHVEARAAYWLGGHAYEPEGWQPFVFATGGLAQVDASIPVNVYEDPNTPPPPNQPDNPPRQRLDAYKKMGSGFLGAGAGVYLPVDAHSGPSLELAALGMFPSTGTDLRLTLGYGFGF